MNNIDYEKKYNAALERARKFCNSEECRVGMTPIDIEVIFPELKQSEDERIKEAIIATIHLYYGEPLEKEAVEMITWLEKQGQTFTKKDVDDAYLKGISDTKNEIEKQYKENYQIRKDIALFIYNYRGDIKDRAKWMDYLGIKVIFDEKRDKKSLGKTALEAINEEKVDNTNKVKLMFKNGDVIVYKDEISIYKHDIKNCTKEGINFGGFVYHCCYDGKSFIINSTYSLSDGDKKDIYPATKEQRRILFTKMSEAGYKWDNKDKKLIKYK